MKVLFLTQSLYIGGAERQLVALATGLQKKGHLSVVATFKRGPLESNLRDATIRVVNFNKSGRWDLFRFLYRLVRVVRRERPDVLHGYLAVPNLLTILLKPFFPQVKMVWGVRASNVDLSSYDWWARFVFHLECFFSRYADLIVANSNAGRDYHSMHGFPHQKMVVVPNGIDTNYFRPDPNARSRKRADWGVNDLEKVIGSVGRFDPMKDHATFLRAAAILAKERDNVRFVCVGDGPQLYKSELSKLATELGLNRRLVWAGACQDMLAIYNAFDVLVSSSSYGEGFPNVVGEAMACGIPCVVTDVGDSARIVHNQQLVVGPGDPEAMSAGIQRALTLNSPAAVRDRVATYFSLDQLVDRTEFVLRSAIEVPTGVHILKL